MFAGTVLEKSLLRAVGRCASQARQIEQHRDLCAGLQCLRRQEDVESHICVGARRLVLELKQLAPEGGDGTGGFKGHDGVSSVVRAEGMLLEAWCRVMERQLTEQ